MDIRPLLTRATTPPGIDGEEGLGYWRARMLHTLLFFSVLLGFLCLVPSVLVLWKRGLWGMVILDTVLYALVVALFFLPSIGYALRALGVSLIFYFIGVGLLVAIGPWNVMPLVWLFTFPLMTGLLLGIVPSLGAQALNLATLTATGVLIHIGVFSPSAGNAVHPLPEWIVTGVNFLALNLLATVCLSLLLRGLKVTLDKERDLRQVRERERGLLREVNESLVQEMAERKRLAEALREHSLRLEADVAERTRALEETNRLLEQEIREHTRAERLLRESEERYADLYDRAPDMYFSVDARDGRILQCNQTLADTLGRSKKEVIGRPVLDLVHPDSREAAQRSLEHFLETGRVQDAELQLLAEDGRRIDVDLNVSAIRDAGGNIVSSRSCLRDITHRKRLEARIRLDEKLASLGIVAGGVAHNLSNILVAVMGFQELGMAKLDPSCEAWKDVRQAHDLSLRAGEMAGKMLSYTGIALFNPQHTDLSHCILGLLPELEASLPPGARLETTLDDRLPFIASEPVLLRQVLWNLVTNAWEALGNGGGVIRVSTGAAECSPEDLRTTYLQEDLPGGTYVYLEVTDPGEGIVAAKLDKIFDPFFTTKVAGRGLGLASVLGIVRAHRGAVEVHSRPGEGSRFRVLFPASSPDAGTVP